MITAAGGTVETGRDRLLKESSEGFSGALGRLVGHCSTCATSGGWESAQKAQDATDAANDLGVDVTNSRTSRREQERLSRRDGLILIIICAKEEKQQATRTAVGGAWGAGSLRVILLVWALAVSSREIFDSHL